MCTAMHPCVNALPVINAEAVAQGDLSANPIAHREFRGPGRKGWDGLFSSPPLSFYIISGPRGVFSIMSM